MTAATPASAGLREPPLAGQTVVLIGGSSGSGLETARQARGQGADVVLVGRDRDRLDQAAAEVDALSTAALDATDPEQLHRFFAELPGPIDHVLVSAGGNYYARLADLDFTQARRLVDDHLWLPLHLARAATGKVRPPGTLLFVDGTVGRRPVGRCTPIDPEAWEPIRTGAADGRTGRHEQSSDCRTRAAVRLPLRRPGHGRRVGRLAVLPAIRRPVGVRPAARRRGGALVDPAGRCLRRHPPVRRSHAGAGDDVPHPDRHGDRDRRAGRGRGQPGARTGPGRAAPADPLGDRGRRGGRRSRSATGRGRSTGCCGRCCRMWTVG